MPVDHDPAGAATARSRLATIYACAVVVVLAAVVAGVAWTRPSTTASVLHYTQTGQLSYSAPAGPGSVYGSPGLTTGQPIYADVIGAVDVSYSYRFESTIAAQLSGTARLMVTINDGQGISRTLPLEPPTSFTGSGYVARGRLDLGAIKAAATAFDRAAGSAAPSAYTVTVSPSVEVHGRLGGAPVSATLDDPVSFAYNGDSLVPASSPATGSSPAQPAQQHPQLGLNQPGSITVAHSRTATLLGKVPVPAARLVSLALLVLAIGIGSVAGRRWLAQATSEHEGLRIAARHGADLVEATELPHGPHIATVQLDSFEGLMQVARRLECPVLHQGGDRDVYAVVDNSCLYQYTIARPEPVGPAVSLPGTALTTATRNGAGSVSAGLDQIEARRLEWVGE